MQKNLRRGFILLFAAFLLGGNAFSQTKIKKTVFQGFWWDYWNNNFKNGWSNYLTELAPRLKSMGFDAIWIPPSYKNASPGSVGYSPFDQYDLGEKYQKGGGDSVTTKTRMGTKDELLRMIAVMHANGIEVIQDVVLNHDDGAGSNGGAGGQDPEPTYSMVNASGYKNFRYSSYATPLLDDSQNDYWSRSGRWSKNYPNFYPNQFNNCTSGDICDALFGPDISYEQSGYGQSSNIPLSGSATIGSVSRPFYNPAQSDFYMRNNARNWLMWFKKQTGVDGWRWDAVKHFPVNVQEDLIYNTKNLLPDWAKSGDNMFCVGEWIGSAGVLDAYVNNVKSGTDKHTGTFDFNLRGYGSTGGLYSMVLGSGGYNMQGLPGEQQSERVMDYTGKRVHRTVPFVNSHDTYRPILDANGNFSQALGVSSGWNEGGELGGNGKHIDPREPRLAVAYATAFAMDGNPAVFFEDLFDIGTTGKRFSHLPNSTTDLPIRSDLQNILQAHQKLSFKDGDYGVPTSLSDAYYQKGSAGDHLVIERKGKAIIGLTDAYSTIANNTQDQEVYVTVDASMKGKLLYDYSGAHGITTSEVFSDARVLIKTAPVGHTISGASGHGYSIWAPAPDGVTITSVQQLYDYLATYAPPRDPSTTIEWELADDLGDSHCKSAGYGGKLPDNSTRHRIAGKVFSGMGKPMTLKIYPETDGRDLTIGFFDLNGNILATTSGISNAATPLTLNYTPTADGWIVVKIHNTNNTTLGQKIFANLVYTAPTVVNTRDAANAVADKVAIWTGNALTTDPTNCGNWEEGKIPDANTNVIIPANAGPNFPAVFATMDAHNITIENGAALNVLAGSILNITGNWINKNTAPQTINGYVHFRGTTQQTIEGLNTFTELEIDNAAGVLLKNNIGVNGLLTFTAGKLIIDNYDLSLAPTAIATSANANSYIQTNNTATGGGSVCATISNTNTLIPIGNTDFTPATLNNIGTPMQFCIRNFEDVLTNGTTGSSIAASGKVRKTWVINPQTATGANVNLTLQWNAANNDNLTNSATFIAKNKGGAGENWMSTQTAGAVSGTGPYTRTTTGITDFSKFSVFSNTTILPVNILHVGAKALSGNVVVSWVVANQEKLSAYNIEKSADGSRFAVIGKVLSQAGTGILSYQFTDNNFKDAAYYRIVSADVDGSVQYSQTVFVPTTNSSRVEYLVAPNPASGRFKLLSNLNATETIQVQLLTLDGRILSNTTGTIETANTVLNTSMLQQTRGIYMIKITNATGSQLLRLIKQ